MKSFCFFIIFILQTCSFHQGTPENNYSVTISFDMRKEVEEVAFLLNDVPAEKKALTLIKLLAKERIDRKNDVAAEQEKISALEKKIENINAAKNISDECSKRSFCAHTVRSCLENFNRKNVLIHGVFSETTPNVKTMFSTIEKHIKANFTEMKKISYMLSSLGDEDMCKEASTGLFETVRKRLKRINLPSESKTSLNTAFLRIRDATDVNEAITAWKADKEFWEEFHLKAPWESRVDEDAVLTLVMEISTKDLEQMIKNEHMPSKIERYMLTVLRNQQLTVFGAKTKEKRYDECMTTIFSESESFSEILEESEKIWPKLLEVDDRIHRFCIDFALLYNSVSYPNMHLAPETCMFMNLRHSCSPGSEDYETFLEQISKGAVDSSGITFVGMVVTGEHAKKLKRKSFTNKQ